MALRIVEFFGFPPLDQAARPFISSLSCPFVGQDCLKPNHGACSVETKNSLDPVVCCPNRMYDENFVVLEEIAKAVFGQSAYLARPADALAATPGARIPVAVFGRYWGQELPLPRPPGTSGSASRTYYVDWILAKLSPSGDLEEMTAVEVQTIDTTGNYSDQAQAYFAGNPFKDSQGRMPGYSAAGMNWENVNKRILPQVIYKGHVLRREAKCTKGLFFVCPKQVYERIRDRLGGQLHSYSPGNGTITFRSYELGPVPAGGRHRKLQLFQQFTTTVDQVALAFTSPMNLPEQNVYEQAIQRALRRI